MNFDPREAVAVVSELKERSGRVEDLSGRVAKEVVTSLESWSKTQSDELSKLLEQVLFTIDLVEGEKK
jgi:hypothetical protein